MKISTQGWVSGFLGVLIFSLSLPATRVAVADFDPLFLTVARASIAGVLAALMLFMSGEKRPDNTALISLVIVAVGVVVGFPLLTALALKTITSAHSTVYIGLLPLATAIFGVWRAGERPAPAFWMFSCLGSACVAGFAALQSGSSLAIGDLYMFGAIVVCGLGYAEGAKLSRVFGGWQVISWALILSLPMMMPVALVTMPNSFADISIQAWAGLGYVSLFSMLIGFVFWYRGLALGGIAAVGQLQLLQPFMALCWAGLLLGEEVSLAMLVVTIAVVACVAGSRHYGQPSPKARSAS
jgi:drug/metabolite transporter (DMT)-like permease